MNSISTSRMYSVQFLSDDRDPGSTPNGPEQFSSVPPQSSTETHYDLIQLCEDLAKIKPYNPPTSSVVI